MLTWRIILVVNLIWVFPSSCCPDNMLTQVHLATEFGNNVTSPYICLLVESLVFLKWLIKILPFVYVLPHGKALPPQGAPTHQCCPLSSSPVAAPSSPGSSFSKSSTELPVRAPAQGGCRCNKKIVINKSSIISYQNQWYKIFACINPQGAVQKYANIFWQIL